MTHHDKQQPKAWVLQSNEAACRVHTHLEATHQKCLKWWVNYGQFDLSEAWLQDGSRSNICWRLPWFHQRQAASRADRADPRLIRIRDSNGFCQTKRWRPSTSPLISTIYPPISALNTEGICSHHCEASKAGSVTVNLKKLIMDPKMSSKSCGRFQHFSAANGTSPALFCCEDLWGSVRHVTLKPFETCREREVTWNTHVTHVMQNTSQRNEKNIFALVTSKCNC